MSSAINLSRLPEPVYYHREYSNDIEKKPDDNSWINTSQRVALVALPFLSLYKPLSFPISLGMGALRTWTCASQLFATIHSGKTDEIPYQLLQTTIAVIALAGTIFAHPLGMVISTGHDVILETMNLIDHLQKEEYEEALESCISIICNSLYLALLLHGGLELAIASLALQILLGLYKSRGEFVKGNYLEGTGHLLMALVRGNQMVTNVRILQLQNTVNAALKSAQEKNKDPQIKTHLTVSVGNENVQASRMDAYRIEQNRIDGCDCHWGYYRDGTVVLTVVHDAYGRIPDGRQGIGDQNKIYFYTDYFIMEAIKGITYVKHIYANGVTVYSTERSQSIVW